MKIARAFVVAFFVSVLPMQAIGDVVARVRNLPAGVTNGSGVNPVVSIRDDDPSHASVSFVGPEPNSNAIVSISAFAVLSNQLRLGGSFTSSGNINGFGLDASAEDVAIGQPGQTVFLDFAVAATSADLQLSLFGIGRFAEGNTIGSSTPSFNASVDYRPAQGILNFSGWHQIINDDPTNFLGIYRRELTLDGDGRRAFGISFAATGRTFGGGGFFDSSNTTRLVGVFDENGEVIDNIKFESGIVPENLAIPEPCCTFIFCPMTMMLARRRNREQR